MFPFLPTIAEKGENAGRGTLRPFANRETATSAAYTITFVAGIYDSDGERVTGPLKRFGLTLPDLQLKCSASGVGVQNTFQLKACKYLLREWSKTLRTSILLPSTGR